MNFKEAVRKQCEIADFMLDSYLADVTSEELLHRPAPGANHVAWQLGHLITAETRLIEAAVPGSMPALPAGFAERHVKDTAGSDNAADFLPKEEYMKVAKSVRAGMLKVLDSLSDADFDKPVSGRLPPWIKKAGDCFITAAGHWVLHSGQWVVLRRHLGRDRKF